MVFALLPCVLAKVAMVPFANGVRQADRILVGTVARVLKVDGHKFADIDVERTLKGPRTASVRIVAEPTWTCDVSSASPGERALFLLDGTKGGDRLRSDPSLGGAILRAGGAWVIDYSGSGKIPLGRGVEVWRDGYSGGYDIGAYRLPNGLRPGAATGDRGRFTEAKFVAAVAAMTEGRSFEAPASSPIPGRRKR